MGIILSKSDRNRLGGLPRISKSFCIRIRWNGVRARKFCFADQCYLLEKSWVNSLLNSIVVSSGQIVEKQVSISPIIVVETLFSELDADITLVTKRCSTPVPSTRVAWSHDNGIRLSCTKAVICKLCHNGFCCRWVSVVETVGSV